MSITKEIKCLKCGSYIHDTVRCTVYQNNYYCVTDEKYKNNCDCFYCGSGERCIYCNGEVDSEKKCFLGHDGSRCVVCNEFLIFGNDEENYGMICNLDHDEPLCEFCNSPAMYKGLLCINDHYKTDPICPECNMPENPFSKDEHDGNGCKVCGTLLNFGRCIYRCVGGGVFCIHCGFEGVVNKICLRCKESNTGQLTKRATK